MPPGRKAPRHGQMRELRLLWRRPATGGSRGLPRRRRAPIRLQRPRRWAGVSRRRASADSVSVIARYTAEISRYGSQ